jgi:hypothetical protein
VSTVILRVEELQSNRTDLHVRVVSEVIALTFQVVRILGIRIISSSTPQSAALRWPLVHVLLWLQIKISQWANMKKERYQIKMRK